MSAIRASLGLLLMVAASRAEPPRVWTVAGIGKETRSGDGGPAEQAGVGQPFGLEIGPDGALYVCEVSNHCVRRIDLKTKVISTVAGSGEKGYFGDGGPATDAKCNEPYEVRFAGGRMYFVEMQNHLVRCVDLKTSLISTVAGSGQPGFGGDNGPALKARLRQPHSIALRQIGQGPLELFIADIGNHRIRRVDLSTGVISTRSGTGERQSTPDGSPVEGTPLHGPRAIDFDRRSPALPLWLALREGNAVFRIDDKGFWRHVAGTGRPGYSGDGGPAKQAVLAGPKGIALAPNGDVYLADTESHAIRVIRQATGVIETVVGDGQPGDGPDGPPRQCRLNRPHGVFVSADGILYIGDSSNHRVRAVRIAREE